MDRIKVNDKYFKPYIGNDRLMEACDAMAARLNEDYAGSEKPVMVLVVMNGAMMFASEMLKRLTFPLELVGVKMSSYSGTSSTGCVKTALGLNRDVSGHDVLILEDIVDTGRTLEALREMLREAGASSAKICCMLFKPGSYQAKEPVEYKTLEIPSKFIVGFGLDYDELGRNYKDIYILDDNQND